jgi:hypothetical protein
MLRLVLDSLRRACLVAGTALVAGCAVYAEPAPVGHGQQPAVHIPPGHYPPPGPCEVLQHQVPPGAVLVQG